MTAPDATLIETDRLLMTGWREDQLADLVRLHGDAETARYLSAEGLAWTEEQARTRLAEWMENFRDHRMGKLRLIRKSDGQFVGRAGFGIFPVTGEPEIGYALLPEHRHQGYATEAASALRDWIFRDTAWNHFIGFADERNAASLKVLRAIGMRETHSAEVRGMNCVFHVYVRSAS